MTAIPKPIGIKSLCQVDMPLKSINQLEEIILVFMVNLYQ